MAFHDNFYIKENIIGFTGSLNELPTVYFLTDRHFGHITQQHDEPDNVGREVIDTTNGYVYGNEEIAGVGEVLCEYKHGRLIHRSRNKLILLAHMNIDAANICAQSIWRHPRIKRIWHRGRRFA
ncbi:hypothetical protein [Mangrovicoccus sp. HB161399]|uniref:hypothetical protein n=1 Tax=Mangrovicoccus sp. HB161399 TaxID=2720392 RepID=UPI0015550B52|nr:hypothetical protein [Mangrovicoccus sp. HB161399]